MRKIINSQTRKYEETVTDTLALDAVPTVNSFNGVTSDGVARAIVGGGNVPAPSEGDDGKVLTVVDGATAWADAQGGSSYTAGDGIAITNNEIKVSVNDDSLLTLEHRVLDRNKDLALSSLAYFKQISPTDSLPYGDLVDGREYTVRFVLQKDGESAMAVSVATLQFTYPGYGSSIMWGTIDVAESGWTYIDSSASDWDQIHYGGCAPKFQLTDSVTGDVYYTETDWTIEAYYPKDGKLRINALPGNNRGDILRWDSDVHGYVPRGFELPYEYMECHKFWGGEYATYTSNDVTIAPDFSQGQDWNGYIDFPGYAHCREVQMYGKFEGNGTTAATNNVSTTVTIVIENKFDNTDTYTLALNAKQYVKNYVYDPQGSQLPRYGIMFCTEDFQIPFNCNARKSGDSDYFLKSIHVAFAGLTSGGTVLNPDNSTSIAFRTSTFPYWE